MSEFKIEKGVLIPCRVGVKRPCPYPFVDMAVGDSFFVPFGDRTLAATRYDISRWASTFRHKEDAPSFSITTAAEAKGIRVWRNSDKHAARSQAKLAPRRDGGDSYRVVDGKRVPA